MLGEEGRDQSHVLRADEARPAVAVVLDHLERDLDAGLFQGVGQQFALPERHEVVLVAVHDQKRGGILIDVRQRAGYAQMCAFLCVFLRELCPLFKKKNCRTKRTRLVRFTLN